MKRELYNDCYWILFRIHAQFVYHNHCLSFLSIVIRNFELGCFTFVLILRYWFWILCGIFFVRIFHDCFYFICGFVVCDRCVVWGWRICFDRRNWSGSLSLSIFAGILVTYLRFHGTEFRRSFYLVLIYT